MQRLSSKKIKNRNKKKALESLHSHDHELIPDSERALLRWMWL